MFINAIEEVGRFTRPIHTITRIPGEHIVNPGAATLFFVNEDSVAITCKHVIEVIGKPQGNTLRYLFSACSGDPTVTFRFINHPEYDLSIIIFEKFKNPLYQSYARFLKDSSKLQPGKTMCRLGFPFPEFNNFQYNVNTDDIEWTNTGSSQTPRFPIEGMMTRHMADQKRIYGVEMSTPGLRGQSGGPLFDLNGIVCGMQSSTNHLHLGFDMHNYEYNINGRKIKVNNQPFLHVGQCIHVDIIKEFLAANAVKFYEE